MSINLEKNYSEKMQPLFELGREPLMGSYNPKTYEPFGFLDGDIDELIQLATDDSYEDFDYEQYEEEIDRFFYATLHAIYVLAGLKATQAIKPLFYAIEDMGEISDFHYDILTEFPKIFGQDAFEPIEAYIFENPQAEILISVIEGLKRIAKKEITIHPRIEQILIRYLQNDTTSDEALAMAISTLIDITGDKHIELIRHTFATKEVDSMWCGDLEDMEIRAGVREKRESPFPGYWVKDEEPDIIVKPQQQINNKPKVGRNDPCPCGSGKKYKKCCLNK